MNSFVAIDFETANHRKISACAVGLATGRNGKIEVVRSFLIRPPQTRFEFTGIHGLRWKDVRGPPLEGRPRRTHLWRTLADPAGLDQRRGIHRGAQCLFRQARASRLLRHVWDQGSEIAVHLYGRACALAVGHLPDTVARCLPSPSYPTVSPRSRVRCGSMCAYRACSRARGMAP